MDIPKAPARTHKPILYVGLSGVVLLASLTWLSTLEPASATVERASLWTGTVRRGEMVREIRGSGSLVAENARVVTAEVSGRVERVFVENGDAVDVGAPLVELRNDELERRAREIERELSKLQSEAVIQQVEQEQERMNLAASLADARAAFLEAKRLADIDQELLESGIASPATAQRSRERADEAARRVELEENRFDLQTRAIEAQAQVNAMDVELQREGMLAERVAARLTVVAESDGVVQDLALQIGQNLSEGATLARIVEPGRLKAVLRVSEIQARELAVGQSAQIDTRSGLIAGRVVRIDPAVQGGTVAVDVSLEGDLPQGARPDLGVEGLIEIERLSEVLQVARPIAVEPNSRIQLFRVDPDGVLARRVELRVGRLSTQAVEVLEGLDEGDEVILSDMSAWADEDRIRLR